MAPSRKLHLCAILLAICSQGMMPGAQGLCCIQVNQHTTGARDRLDTEFEVEVRNVCSITQRNVRLYARGFASNRPVEPKLFRRDGDAFLVYGGDPIASGAAITFRYWWDHATFFSPACSEAAY